MPQYTSLIFDLDGTLLNTLSDLATSVNHALKTNGLPERSITDIRLFCGNGIRNLIKLSVPPNTSETMYEAVFQSFRNYYLAHSLDQTKPYEGIPELLHVLKARGFNIAIVSNKLQLAVSKLHQRFFFDTISVAIGEKPGISRKPAPDMINLALRLMKATTSQTIYIGDSEVDLLTSSNANLPCISVLWGFRDMGTLVQAGATHFAKSPADILEIIQDLSFEHSAAN